MFDSLMAPLSTLEAFGASVEMALKKLNWTPADLSERTGLSRQWGYRIINGQQKSTDFSHIDKLAAVFTEALGISVVAADLFQPDLLKNKLKNPATYPVTSPSNTGIRDSPHVAADVRASLSRIERSHAEQTSLWFDVYTLLASHFRGDSGNSRSTPPPIAKAAGSGKGRRKPR